MKKAIVFLLALALLLCPPAFAATEVTTINDVKFINITNSPEEGESLIAPATSYAYQISGSLSKSFYPGASKAIQFVVTNLGSSNLTVRISPAGGSTSTTYVGAGKTTVITYTGHSSYSISCSGTGYLSVYY